VFLSDEDDALVPGCLTAGRPVAHQLHFLRTEDG
jgi:hypothetical protein